MNPTTLLIACTLLAGCVYGDLSEDQNSSDQTCDTIRSGFCVCADQIFGLDRSTCVEIFNREVGEDPTTQTCINFAEEFPECDAYYE